MRNIRVSVPKAMIPLRDRDRELGEQTGVRIPGDRGAGAVASALTRQLAHSVDELPAPQVARLGTAVVDVLAVALAGRLDRTSAVPAARERTLLHRIYAFVEQQLADPRALAAYPRRRAPHLAALPAQAVRGRAGDRRRLGASASAGAMSSGPA